jgi:hypothetical protein
MAQPSNRTTMQELLSRQSTLATECWWQWYEYEAASKGDKPAIEKEIEALRPEIYTLETMIFNHRPAAQCSGAGRSRRIPQSAATFRRDGGHIIDFPRAAYSLD